MSVKVKVSKEARQYVRKILKEHPENLAQIKVLEKALRFPHRETDENIGGGRSSYKNSPVEIEYERVWTNSQFLAMISEIEKVEQVMNMIEDDVAKQVITERYFNLTKDRNGHRNLNSWEKVAQSIGCISVDACRKIETKIIDKIAKELKMR